MSLIINTLVVDDEPLAQALVAGYVGLAPFLSLVGCCSSASEATARIADGGVDLVLLDIQMPGMLMADGFTKKAEKIRAQLEAAQTPEQKEFLQAMLDVLDLVTAFAARYREEAVRVGNQTVADMLAWIPGATSAAVPSRWPGS